MAKTALNDEIMDEAMMYIEEDEDDEDMDDMEEDDEEEDVDEIEELEDEEIEMLSHHHPVISRKRKYEFDKTLWK